VTAPDPRVLRLLNGAFHPDTAHPSRLPFIPPNLARMIRAMIGEYESQLAAYKEALEQADENRDRLRMLQHVLIAMLQQQGGTVTLYAGQLGEIPPGSVVGVEKLAPGEGDRVPLRIYWRPPGAPAQTDLHPEG
jgi:hypothetical protein